MASHEKNHSGRPTPFFINNRRLDIKLYQHADSLPKGKQDPEFKKKPDLALELIDACRNRGGEPGVILIDGGYGNNGKLMQKIQDRDLTYIVGVANLTM